VATDVVRAEDGENLLQFCRCLAMPVVLLSNRIDLGQDLLGLVLDAAPAE
jgi:hypothetical protein